MSKGLAAGIFIAIICGGILGYGISYILPNDQGRVLQTKFTSVRTAADINDGDMIKEGIPDTSLSITTEGSSYLIMRFTGMFFLHLDTTFVGSCRFNVTMELNAVPKRTGRISYFASPSLGVMLEISQCLTVEYVTSSLPAGTYTVNMTWVSLMNPTGTNTLNACTPSFNYSRTILIQEIHI